MTNRERVLAKLIYFLMNELGKDEFECPACDPLCTDSFEIEKVDSENKIHIKRIKNARN